MKILVIAEEKLINVGSFREFKSSIRFDFKYPSCRTPFGPYDALLLSSSFSTNYYSKWLYKDGGKLLKEEFNKYLGFIFLINNKPGSYNESFLDFLNDIFSLPKNKFKIISSKYITNSCGYDSMTFHFSFDNLPKNKFQVLHKIENTDEIVGLRLKDKRRYIVPFDFFQKNA